MGRLPSRLKSSRLLGLKSGDKILFFQKPNGEVVINNASRPKQLYKAQKAFEGVAEEIGVCTDDDVQALVDEVRYGRDK